MSDHGEEKLHGRRGLRPGVRPHLEVLPGNTRPSYICYVARGLSQAAAERAANKIRPRRFDYRGFNYDPTTGRAVFT